MKFAKEYKDYGQDLDILSRYVESSILAITRASSLTDKEAEEFVLSQPEMKTVKDTKIKFLLKDNKGIRRPKEVPIVDYLVKLGESDNVLTPTFTSFLSKDVKEAPQPKYIRRKMAERKKVKKAAIAANNAKDAVKATILTGIQNAIKVLINSFSGAALSAYNPFYSGSLHQVLCAMCRCSTAIATSIIERVIAGIRFYHKPSLVTDDLLQTIAKTNRTKVLIAMEALDLKFPTKEECLDIIRRSTIDYWWDEELEQEYMPILDSMDKVERASFVYSLDLYNMTRLNPVTMKKMMADLTFNDYNSLDTKVPWVMDDLSDDETNFLSGLIGEDIKGTFLYDNLKEGNPMRDKINALAFRLRNTLMEYSFITDAFFLTDILPLDIGNQDKAIRYATSLGDTDSCLYTTMLINELYYGEATFTPDQNPITEMCIFFANGAIEHGLGVFSGQMNVHPDDRYTLSLKNEYRFNSLQLTPYKKTYFASLASQEGAVFSDDNRKYEIKGLRFHGSKSNQDMIDELHVWMKELPWKLKRGEKISRTELIDIILNIEKDILSSLDRKDDHKFSRLTVKHFESYNRPRSEPWAKHLLWNWAFGKTHGEGSSEGYGSYKLPLKFEGGVSEFIDNASPAVRDGFNKYLDYVCNGDDSKRSSRTITYITIPMDSMRMHGIPDELKPLVDLEKTIKTAIDPHLLMLANLGIVLFKDNKTAGLNKVLQKRISDILI